MKKVQKFYVVAWNKVTGDFEQTQQRAVNKAQATRLFERKHSSYYAIHVTIEQMRSHRSLPQLQA